ncbi:MAG: TIGR04283 family arsenosugar biosynthesis glycosyltransferase [Candidatus Accumulibacter sp.]|uniref:TIGR04283 family arsenosugar biosynthesis glycosyltransferase n=1 Tax=Accumulibacter sp. TaxID=2053492 RepID=UPI001D514590|nr:TIGR04283 family arsenosugar biosynthesis glycosyltransferase [Accumulibacter sp.]MCB1943383.1 TIGR04283 family arsenosugar biosynthesis glycosyltransferase [Accumulibacter sp.]MCP5247415.1 TIGR04283 family arsenosugar biosynthesis glycosyltransferase [Accumulibacter sp.]
MSTISVVIPVLNEELRLGGTLANVLPQLPEEVLVVDGGSRDATVAIATATAGVRLLRADKGRARQMNAGAAAARGDWLLFLHADTLLPPQALARIAALPASVLAGAFRHRFSGDDWRLRLISRLDNYRTRLTRIAFGDQAMFVRRELFERLGGFPPCEVMEDVAFGERLRHATAPILLADEAITDSRKFEQMGIWSSLARVAVLLVCHRLRLPLVGRRFFSEVR